MIRCILKYPGDEPTLFKVDPKDTLAGLQQAVGEVVEMGRFDDEVRLWWDENGLLKRLPLNLDFAGIGIVGPVLFTGSHEGDEGEEIASLTPEQEERVRAYIAKSSL